MPFRQTLQNNLTWKIFALVLATSIWFWVHRQLKIQVIPLNDDSVKPRSRLNDGEGLAAVFLTDVPIRTLVKAGQETQFRISPSKVNVELRADKSVNNASTVSWGEVHALVDLTDVEGPGPGRTSQFLRPVLVSAPIGLTWVKADPPSVLVERVVRPEPAK